MTLTFSTITSREDWNSALAKLPYAHILQTWEWGEFKYETTGWKPHRWVFKHGDEIVAMCSMGERRFGIFSLMYAPKGPAMDYGNSALVDEVLALLQSKAKEANAIWLKIDPDVAYAIGVPGEEDDKPAPIGAALLAKLEKNGWQLSDEQVQFRNTVSIDLTLSEEELLAGMSQNTRRKVRTAEKKDVSIRAGNIADLDLLYDLYSSTGERNDFLIRPRDYYLKLWRYFMENDLAHALIAEFEGKAIAHVILFHFGQTCWYFYGASSNEERERMPTYALQWEAMKWAKQRGYKFYDMWGAPNEFKEDDPMWGVFVFKRGFRGTVEQRLGAWDYTPNQFLYTAFTQTWPRLREWLRKLRS